MIFPLGKIYLFFSPRSTVNTRMEANRDSLVREKKRDQMEGIGPLEPGKIHSCSVYRVKCNSKIVVSQLAARYPEKRKEVFI